MALAQRPRNATPQRLNLTAPSVPRMPFSSPMGEEVLSPTSDPSRTPPQQRDRSELRSISHSAQRGLVGGRVGDSVFRGEQSPATKGRSKRDGPSASRRDGPRDQQKSQERSRELPQGAQRTDSPNRSKWPGLNVITDFSKGVDIMTKGSRPKQIHQRGRAESIKATATPSQRHDRSAKTHGIPTPSPDPRNGQRKNASPLPKSAGSRSRVVDLRRASSKISNISPSDRAIMIGISIPAEELNQQNLVPVVERNSKSERVPEARRPSLTPSVAPSIVITPAEDATQLLGTASTEGQAKSRRPVSSLYSQLPPPPARVVVSDMVPPVPRIPVNAEHKSPYINDVQTTTRSGKGRIMSSCTVFDEEPSPQATTHGKPENDKQGLTVLTRAPSQDTMSTKRRSQGWWNVLVSPFFTKSPISPDFPIPGAENETVPPLPSRSHQVGARKDMDSQANGGSAQHYLPQRTQSAHTSFTDSTLDAECEKLALGFGTTALQATPSPQIEAKQALARVSTYIPDKFEGLGAASEYFEACLYDMHSTAPFFECQNHTCLPSTMTNFYDFGIDAGSSGARGLALEDPDDMRAVPAMLRPGPQPLASAFTTPVKKRGPAVSRPVSDVTCFDDIDCSPGIHKAQAAPILRAPEPISTSPIKAREVDVSPISPVRMPEESTFTSHLPQPTHARMPEESHFFIEPDETPKPLPVPPPRAPAKDITPERTKGKSPRRMVAVLPPTPRHKINEAPKSPPPASPGIFQQEIPKRSIPLDTFPASTPLRSDSLPPAAPVIVTSSRDRSLPRERPSLERTTTADLWPPPRPPREARWYDDNWTTKEHYKLPPRQPKKPNRFAALWTHFQQKHKSISLTDDRRRKQKRRRLYIIVSIVLLLLIILIMVLAMTLNRKGDKMKVQTAWLNITGYPPIPTGISTIAQPNIVHEQSGCVQPTSMWSCAVPKEDQQTIAPVVPNQPNFRVEIRFRNGTNATVGNSSSANLSHVTGRSIAGTKGMSARMLIRRYSLHLRDALTSALYTPSPAPPSQEDQTFLGNTTDGVQAPYDGEYTPFYMTFQSPAPLQSRAQKSKRSASSNTSTSSSGSNTNSTDPFPNLTASIPAPMTNPDGTATSAVLYPFPSAQPLRLFDRGLSTEHYGFYTYFDRRIFLSSTSPLNTSAITGNAAPPNASDLNGGSPAAEAQAVCTWTQTRFLVQIWTQRSGRIIGDGFNTSASSTSSGKNESLDTSSANALTRPGSFPYPITLTLDRHGGDVKTKMAYCYALDTSAFSNSNSAAGKPIPGSGRIQLEDRSYGGTLVNPAQGPFGNVRVKTTDGGPGGIDGGKGDVGCGCVWRNWT